MGGKSRKTGGVSKKLIQRLVKEHAAGGGGRSKKKDKKEIESEKSQKGFGFTNE
jgi:hypothetical protein